MSYKNRYDAVDASIQAHGLQAGGPPFATAAAVLLDKAGLEVFSADDLVTALANLLASAGAGAAISTLTSGTDLTVSGVLTTLGTNIGAHDAQGITLLAALLATTGAGAAILPKTNIVSTASPLTTESVTASATKQHETIYVTPAGTIAAMTFVFPTNANSSLGQVIRLVSHQIVTTLTVSSSGLTILGSAVTALAVDTPVSWQKVAASTWMRL